MPRNHFPSLLTAARRRDERGMIIVVALVVLVLLTIIGISASNTSTIEIQTAGNERTFKQNFYLAEAAAMRAMSELEVLPAATLKTYNGGKIKDEVFLHDAVPANSNFTTQANWQSIAGTDTFYLQCNLGSIDMDMTSPTHVYEYAVYGKIRENNRDSTIIQVGYKRRY